MIRTVLLATLLVGFCWAEDPLDFVNVFSSVNAEEPLGYRLPNDTYPVRYDISLTTHIHLDSSATEEQRFRFQGTVGITLKAATPTNRIVLQHRQLNILNAQLTEGLNEDPIQSWQGSELFYNSTFETLVFDLNADLNPEETYILRIAYTGNLRDDEAGFYHSSYTENGKKVWLATTQFESTDARHAFPCYDEPGIRAVYSLSIKHGSTFFALANTPIRSKSDAPEDGYTITLFEDTPVMQTYLLCFVISDFTFVAIQGRIPQRVFARKQAIEAGHGDFAVRAGVNILRQIDSYLYLDYGSQMKKMDQIAIPDFAAGAMENWGLVTYREPALLFNEKTDTFGDKVGVATIIAHEYTHQYFGNLVSPKWWSYLWLNEGFANLYGYLAVAPVYPEMVADEFYQFSQLQGVLNTDGFGETRPMTTYIETPRAISGIFDSIAYPKSGSVLRMWLHALGENVWREGLNNYLTEMALQAAEPEDLARGLQTAVTKHGVNLDGLTMTDIVLNWSNLAGYPVVTVSMPNPSTLSFTQSKFLYSQNQPRNSDIWYIPLTVQSKSTHDFNRTTAQVWMQEAALEQTKEPTKSIDWDENDWIVVNAQQTGYYRVNYEAKLWDRIIEKLKSESFSDLPQATRSQLLNDAFSLARAELLDYVTIFRLLDYLHQEKHWLPWNTVGSGLSYLDRLLADKPPHELFFRLVQHLISPLYDHYGTRDLGNSENWGDKRARDQAINWACKVGYSNCRKETNEIMLHAVEGHVELVPDLQQTIFCAGLRESGRDEFLSVWGKQQASSDGTFRSRLLRGLGCNVDPENQQVYLQSTLAANTNYRAGEYSTVINSVYTSSTQGVHSAIHFLNQNTRQAQDKYGGLQGHASNMASLISSTELMEKYTNLLTKLRQENIVTESQQTSYLRVAQTNLDWVESNQEEIFDYLKEVFKTNDGNRVSSVLGTVLALAVAITMFFR